MSGVRRAAARGVSSRTRACRSPYCTGCWRCSGSARCGSHTAHAASSMPPREGAKGWLHSRPSSSGSHARWRRPRPWCSSSRRCRGRRCPPASSSWDWRACLGRSDRRRCGGRRRRKCPSHTHRPGTAEQQQQRGQASPDKLVRNHDKTIEDYRRGIFAKRILRS